jgi:hypothetical protein
LITALKAPMNADPTPMAADIGWAFASMSAAPIIQFSSAAIGVGSAAIGVFKDFRADNSPTHK